MLKETTITLPSELHKGALMALVGLGVSVMQHNEQSVNAFAESLSQPGMQAICEQVLDILSGVSDADRH
jgi:hypothetical protein